ncbi:branched-chain amino-acid transaminase [Aspergillus saccharolyticus JOP 1030-1]|uniref:Branched-chain amino-acid transaminase n=1 Tax=Aspergillus saccharolyticus JOP 1030-1 TaxID=1450539 RepID=A0A318ZIA1_9EURO|nr:branched-chain amino-acid transaminase [Aspergillus saccharolyticus JOP 1030-1]PYH46497.1 branched-chain amino-acid transaminase [Aspergillus saccharolyticus JOP 1030-1]
MSTFPAEPRDNIEWEKVGVSFLDVNGHVESDFDYQTGTWSAPIFVEDQYLRVHGLAPGLNYGQQVFEGMKAYRTKTNEIQVFRPSEHARRMQRSCEAVAIPAIPAAVFQEAVNLAVARNSEFVPPHATEAALYIRPLAFGSGGWMPVAAGMQYKFCVYAMPFCAYHGTLPVDAVVLEELDRAAPVGVGNVKVGGNYAPVLKWSDKARKEGFGITLHLDSKTRSEIDEFSTSGFVGIKYGETPEAYTVVVPNSQCVIKSVTSMSVVELARHLGWKVEVRPIPFDELAFFDEVLAVGTAAMITSIRSITHRSRNQVFHYQTSDTPGSVCEKLSTKLKAIQKGDAADPFGWLGPVVNPAAREQTPSVAERAKESQGETVSVN